ncbi:hypothetical protein ACJ41O_011866 [Fusarium nematophilum]
MNAYIQKDQKNLTAFLSMFSLFYVSISDLTRMPLAGYNFPLAGALANTPADFITKQRERCYQSADAVTQVFNTGFAHNIESVDDVISAAAAFKSTKIQVIYLTTVAKRDRALAAHVRNNINQNLRVLTVFHRHPDSTNIFIRTSVPLSALCPFLAHFGFPDVSARWKPYQRAVLVPRPPPQSSVSSPTGNCNQAEDDASSGIIGPDEISYLNQLATYRLMTVDAQTLGVNPAPPPEARPDGRSPSRGEIRPSHHGTIQSQLQNKHAEQQLYGPSFWPELVTASNHMQLEQSAEYPAAGALTDMSAMPPGVLQDLGSEANLDGTVDDEYYQRMAGCISDYITWDGNLSIFGPNDVFETS